VSLFVDTSVWYAAADSEDEDNARAIAILSTGEPLVTSDHVLVETWRLLRDRAGRHRAEQFWDSLRSGLAAIEPIVAADLQDAWHIGLSFPDQDFSLVDRTSFAVMLRLGIERAASFDNDFIIFRFGPNRRRAFTIVR